MSGKNLQNDLNELKSLNMQGILLHLSTKEDLYQAKSELRSEMATVKSELRDEIHKVEIQVNEVRTTLKWGNRFLITTLLGVIIGLIKAFWSNF